MTVPARAFKRAQCAAPAQQHRMLEFLKPVPLKSCDKRRYDKKMSRRSDVASIYVHTVFVFGLISLPSSSCACIKSRSLFCCRMRLTVTLLIRPHFASYPVNWLNWSGLV